MTPKEVEQAKEFQQCGISLTKIALKLGYCRSTIQRYLNPAARLRHTQQQKNRYHSDPDYKRLHNKRTTDRNKKRYGEDIAFRIHRRLLNTNSKAKREGYSGCNATVEQILACYTGRCECCGIEASELSRHLAIDHCHKTGEFRGLLCSACNTAIGLLNERPDLAVQYLENRK